MDIATPRQTIDQLYAAFGAGDVPGILALLHPEVVWSFNCPNPPVGPGGTRHGHAGATDFFVQVGTAEDIHEFVIDHIVTEGNQVAVRGHERVTHRSTGKGWECPWVHWFTVVDGLVTRYEGYIDSAAVAEAYTP